MIAKELSWKPTEREELIEILRHKFEIDKLKSDKNIMTCLGGTIREVEKACEESADAILEWHKKGLEEMWSKRNECTKSYCLHADVGYPICQNCKDTYNGGSVSPEKGRMK
jgi:hypothetical protein